MKPKEDRLQKVICYYFNLIILVYLISIVLLGIWMCKANDIPLLVMDVEGTDGRERGEDQVRFFIYCSWKFN